MISYDCRTKQIEIIPPPIINSTKNFDHSNWDFGQTNGRLELDTNPPQVTHPNIKMLTEKSFSSNSSKAFLV